MIDESTGYLNDLLKILENVNFKGTNFKMPHSILPVAIHNQTGNTLGTYIQLKMIKIGPFTFDVMSTYCAVHISPIFK